MQKKIWKLPRVWKLHVRTAFANVTVPGLAVIFRVLPEDLAMPCQPCWLIPMLPQMRFLARWICYNFFLWLKSVNMLAEHFAWISSSF